MQFSYKNKISKKALQLSIIIFIAVFSFSFKEKAFAFNEPSTFSIVHATKTVEISCTVAHTDILIKWSSFEIAVSNPSEYAPYLENGTNQAIITSSNLCTTAGTISNYVYDNVLTPNTDYAIVSPDFSSYYDGVYHAPIYWVHKIHFVNTTTGFQEATPPNTTSRFTSISVSTSTNTLNLQGYWNASSTLLLYQIADGIRMGYSTLVHLFLPSSNDTISATSSGTFNQNYAISIKNCLYSASSTVCVTDNSDSWYATLYDGSDWKDATSTTIQNQIGTTTITSQQYQDQFFIATIGDGGVASSTSLLGFLNVPHLLQTRIPFAYIFQITNGIYIGITSSSSTAIPSGNFIWKNTQNGTTTFDFFSPTTIQVYMNPTIISLWRAFLLVILTIEFGYALYRRTTKHNII